VLQARNGVVALQGEGLFTNFLHNGDVPVDQRNTLATPITVTNTTTYGPDGWAATKINATNVVTIGKVAIVNTPATGTYYACKLNVTTGAIQGASEYMYILRAIEGTIFRRASFGTAQAANLYLSFWAESTLTGTFSISLRNGSSTRSYVANCSITAANTRQLFQITIPGDTTGTWATDNTVGAYLAFTPAVGTTFQTSSGTWQAGNFLGRSSTNLLNNVTGSLQISDCYLGLTPIGTSSIDFPRLQEDTELIRCQRYLRWYPTSNTIQPSLIIGGMDSATGSRFIFALDPQMRATPSLLFSSVSHFTHLAMGSAGQVLNSLSLSTASTASVAMINGGSATGTGTQGDAARLITALVSGGYLGFSAELQ
jgi:hypothetical protein